MNHENPVQDRVEDIISGKLACIKLPWDRLTYFTNALIPGTMTLLCGDPGASKSFMLLQALLHLYNAGHRVSVYELENGKEFHLLRLLAQKTGNSGIVDLNWVNQNPEQARDLIQKGHDFLCEFEDIMYVSAAKAPTLKNLSQWVEGEAKDGVRIICIDPMTMATRTTGRPWEEDAEFLADVGHIAAKYYCSVVLVTHPTKVNNGFGPDMALLSGSAAYSRFCDTIIWLEAHDEKEGKVKGYCGEQDVTYNRTLHILKARHGIGRGIRLATTFMSDSLTLREFGVIVKKPKKGAKE
jgi:hypothetical protein